MVVRYCSSFAGILDSSGRFGAGIEEVDPSRSCFLKDCEAADPCWIVAINSCCSSASLTWVACLRRSARDRLLRYSCETVGEASWSVDMVVRDDSDASFAGGIKSIHEGWVLSASRLCSGAREPDRVLGVITPDGPNAKSSVKIIRSLALGVAVNSVKGCNTPKYIRDKESRIVYFKN